ncbi:hypothetical protein N8469_00540 [bacterium]|nr:hypothetical protein [Candidatus Gracilibacteria bacterium]MDA7495980.1 hypothetical protein [bacterium]
MARKQVERLRPSARLQAVARPVETYVRPAEQPAPKSGLGEFIRAIAPAAETLAQIEKQKKLKLQREAEQGIASARTLDAKIATAAALRAAKQDFTNNVPDYLDMSEEQVTARRAEIMQPFIQETENSGDDLLIKAVKGNIEMGNLAWFNRDYDPAKFKHNFTINMGKVGNEVLGINSDVGYGFVPEDEYGKLLDPAAVAVEERLKFDQQKKNIDEIVRQASQAYGYSQTMVNDYIMEKVIAPNVRSGGRGAAYEWAEDRKFRGIDRYQAMYKTIDSDLRAYDKEFNKQNDNILFTQKLNQGFESFVFGGSNNQQDYFRGETLTGAGGTKLVMDDDETIARFEAYAASRGLNQDQFEDFFKKNNLLPSNMKNNIQNGIYALNSGDIISNPTDAATAELAFNSIFKAQAMGIDIPTSVVDADQLERFEIAKILAMRTATVGSKDDGTVNIANAMFTAQSADLSIGETLSAENEKKLASSISTFLGTDHTDTGNSRANIEELSRMTGLLMQLEGGLSLENAANMAAEAFKKDSVIYQAANGLKMSFRQLNTDPNVSAPVAQRLTDLSKVMSDDPDIKIIMNGELGMIENPTVGFSNDRLKPNAVRISIMDENGFPHIPLGVVKKADLLNDPQIVAKIIASNKNKVILAKKKAFSGGSLAPEDDPVNAPINVSAAWANNNLGNSVTSLPDTFKPLTAQPIVVDGEPTGQYYYTGITADGSKPTYVSTQSPEYIKPEPVEPPDVVEDEPTVEEQQTSSLADDALDVVTNLIDNTVGISTANAASTIIDDEGFSYTPYDDMGKDSVGHGLQIESLEPDEKALISDINNVQPEESAAVVALKVAKIDNYFTDVVEGFQNLPDTAKSGMIQMGYQLGRFNVTKEWPKFMESIKEAAQYAEGSVEQASALLEAKFNMLYNVAADGTVSATKWATQTKDRAIKVAEEIISDAELPSIIQEAAASTRAFPLPKQKPERGTVLDALNEKEASSNFIAAPYKALFANTLGNMLGADFEFSTEDIGEDTLSVIKTATATAEARGSRSVEYGDYPLTKRGLPVSAVIANFKSIDGTRLSKAERKKMEKAVNDVYPNNPIGLAMFAYDLQTDPVLKAAGFVGGFSIQKDKSGRKFIKERWNFNNKSTSEGTIYKKMRAFFSNYAPITEDEGSEVIVELN